MRSAALPRRSPPRSRAAWRASVSSGSTSFTCTIRSRCRAADRRSASNRCSATWSRHSSACVSAQVVYNMLNPSAAEALPNNYPAQDYGRLFDHTEKAGTGVVGIRVLAGGALSGSGERHPIASPPPEPIGSAMSYDADIDRARRLTPLITEGFAESLTEAATRLALSHPAMGTIL